MNSNIDGGVIVARNVLSYPDGMMQWRIRSTFTFEARDGRFRIEQTNLERFNSTAGGWGPIGKWTFSGWKKAETAFAAAANAVAQCVMTGPDKAAW
ncbi:MAG: hypothetical protein ABIS14_10495 [Sphingomonas sp.]